jgi:hypothetical protein
MPTASAAWALALLLTLAGTSARAEGEVSADLRGLFRSRAYFFHLGSTEALALPAGQATPEALSPYTVEFVARPEVVLHLGDNLSGVGTVHAVRWVGLAAERGALGQFRVDRAYIDYTRERLDLRLGRQALNFGSGLIWSPVDLFDANTPLNFSVEKVGVDSVRASYSLGSTTRLMGVLALQGGKPITLARAQWVVGSTGMALMAADRSSSREQVLGFDMKGDLLLGYWVEGTVHLPRDRSPFYRLLLGVDYSFPVLQMLSLSAQYYRDSSGGTGLEDYDFPAYLAGTRSFLGRQYLSLTGDLGLTESSSATAAFVFNLEDRSGLAIAGLRTTFLDNLQVSGRFILSHGFDGPGEFSPTGTHPLRNLVSTRTLELLLEWSL